MGIAHKKLRGTVSRSMLGLWLVLSSAAMAFGQANQRQLPTAPALDKARVSDAIARMNSGEFKSYDVELIRKAHAVEAIPALEKQFAKIQLPPKEPTSPEELSDLLDKAKIATVLVRFAVKDDAYWDFLARLAASALASDAPGFMTFDAEGKAQVGPSPEFAAWARAHNISLNDGHAAEENVYILPGFVAFLGMTGDVRAVPLLRQALLSPNWMIQVMGANGLSEIQDRESIPLIVEACRRAPSEAASKIAESLVYFDDPDAQGAVDTYVPKERAKVLRDAKAQGRKTPLSD